MSAESAIPSVNGTKLVPTPSHPIRSHRLELHADQEALLESAVGAPFALRLVDQASLVLDARVLLVVLHRTLEEAFATLTGLEAVVVAGDLVRADWTLVVNDELANLVSRHRRHRGDVAVVAVAVVTHGGGVVVAD